MNTTITYGSVCSGIEAPSAAWHPSPLAWKPLWFSEVEPFPKAVLAHRYPTVPDLGDMTTLPARILAGEVPDVDVFVGGTPCQSFSVAGLRLGLADPRGQLTRTYVEILDALDTVRLAKGKPPTVALWENVPGVLSDKDNAFGNFLGALCGEDDALLPAGPRWTNAGSVLGPRRALAWRVLDAQYFGVAQRRKRVFLVASARAGGVDPVEVLLVEQGVQRNPPSRGEAGQATPADARGGAALGGGATGHGDLAGDGGRGRGVGFPDPAYAVTGGLKLGSGRSNQDTFVALPGADASEDGTGRGNPIVNVGMAVRRLTPRECERLQGFPDDYTAIPWRGKAESECPDGPRYKALGNSMAVPVIRWLGLRIARSLGRSA